MIFSNDNFSTTLTLACLMIFASSAQASRLEEYTFKELSKRNASDLDLNFPTDLASALNALQYCNLPPKKNIRFGDTIETLGIEAPRGGPITYTIQSSSSKPDGTLQKTTHQVVVKYSPSTDSRTYSCKLSSK